MCLCCKFSCFTCGGDQSSAGARKQKQNALQGKSSSGGGQPAGSGKGKQSSKNQKENSQQDCYFSCGGQGQQGQQGCFSCWSGGATNQEPNVQLELKASFQTNQDVDDTSS
ncbi:hypothetical protein SLA2020_240290 [Shorea laevis]